MAAITMWNRMTVTSSGIGLDEIYNAAHCTSNYYGGGRPAAIRGNLPPSVPITIDSSNCNLRVWMNGDGGSSVKIMTLYSGTNLDCRMLAKYITDQMHASPPGGDTGQWEDAYCILRKNGFELRSGIAGTNSQIKVENTTNSAAATLGFSEGVTFNGSELGRLYDGEYSCQGRLTNVYNGSISVSGIYTGGGFDEYMIVAVEDSLKGGGATVISHPSGTFAGSVTLGGVYAYHRDAVLHLIVTATGGSAYMNGVKDTCPEIHWYMTVPTASGTDEDPTFISMSGTHKLLYPDYPMDISGKGLWVRFSNHPFDTTDAWTIECSGIAKGSNYTAGQSERKIIWSSLRGDTQWEPQDTATFGSFIEVGNYGIHMAFNQNYPIESGDVFKIRVPGPQVYGWDITSINLGNITVSTTSAVFCTTFNLVGGAVELTNVKFGLLDDGGMSQHNGTDTYFSWGTAGAGQEAVDGSLHWQWRNGVDATDLVPTKPPYLYAIDKDLQEVATADDSKTIGVNSFEGLQSDFIWDAIRLGADESGPKTITYRCYFDYS